MSRADGKTSEAITSLLYEEVLTSSERNLILAILGVGTLDIPTFSGLVSTGKVIGKNIPDPAFLPKFRLALAATRNGTADTKILCIGDSITAGVGGSTVATIPASKSYPRQLSKLLNARTCLAAQGIGNPRRYSGDKDDRWTYGTGWGFSSISWSEATATAPAGALVYTPDGGETYDSFDVYYITNGGLGNLAVTATGGSTASFSTGAALGIGKVTVASAAATTTNSVSITSTGAGVYVTGVEPFLSTTKKVRVGNVGVPGSTSTQWNSATTGYNILAEVTAYAPNLTIICLGMNDAGGAGSPAVLAANLVAIITHAKTLGDVILVTPPPPSGGSYQTSMALYATVYEAVGVSQAVNVVDIYNRFGGTWQTSFMADALHPNDNGYWDIAAAISTLISANL